MQPSYIVFKELRERRVRLLTGFLAIFLAIVVIVCVQSISRSSQEAVRKQLRNLGANMFVLPQELSLNDFYIADYGTAFIPETYLYRLKAERLEGIEMVKGQLSRRLNLAGQQAILTGVLFEGESSGATSDLTFNSGEVLLGSEIARELNSKGGEVLEIKGREFTIAKILPEKGNIDDIRIFAPLFIVQSLLGEGKVINQIEIIITKTEVQERLSEEIEALLPGTKVVTKGRIAQAQANTISFLNKYSLILLTVILFIAGMSIANYMSLNVRERRREIGTLLAMGATPKLILKVFLQKAIILGFLGGIAGYIFGTILAVFFGPRVVQVPVMPSGLWFIWSVLGAIFFAVISSVFPARKAACLDPAEILQEE